MLDFDKIAADALKDEPIYEAIVTDKIDGLTNVEIQQHLLTDFQKTMTPEHISYLYRNTIPKLIAETAKEQYILWYYKQNGGH